MDISLFKVFLKPPPDSRTLLKELSLPTNRPRTQLEKQSHFSLFPFMCISQIFAWWHRPVTQHLAGQDRKTISSRPAWAAQQDLKKTKQSSAKPNKSPLPLDRKFSMVAATSWLAAVGHWKGPPGRHKTAGRDSKQAKPRQSPFQRAKRGFLNGARPAIQPQTPASPSFSIRASVALIGKQKS